MITTAAVLDCEISSRPELTVVASDNGRIPLKSAARVVISVLDVNDNAPVFAQAVYNVTIREDEPVNKCFLKVMLLGTLL